MIMRGLIMVVSLSMLAGAGMSSWYGLGAVSKDTGVNSVRTGSVGVGGIRRVRVK